MVRTDRIRPLRGGGILTGPALLRAWCARRRQAPTVVARLAALYAVHPDTARGWLSGARACHWSVTPAELQRARAEAFAWRRPAPLREIAAACGVTVGTACHWAAGVRTPTLGHACAIEVLTGIPASSWTSPRHKEAAIRAQ